MRPIPFQRQRLPSPSHTTAQQGLLAAMLGLMLLLPLACTDVVAPRDYSVDEVTLKGSPSLQRRPFKVSQAWDASGNDFTTPCVALIPHPAIPGASLEVVLPGVSHGQGTATHLGRHSVDIYTTYCVWDTGVEALDARGPWQVVVASGDTVFGTYQAHGTFSATGADFFGTMLIQGGTGRFTAASGEASIKTHDELDGSGWDEGTGWIAY